MLTAVLFDADGDDKAVQFGADSFANLADRQLLWVDVLDPTEAELDEVGSALASDGVDGAVPELADGPVVPRLINRQSSIELHLGVVSVEANPPIVRPLFVVVGANYLVTMHRHPVEFFNDLGEQVRGETRVGDLDAAAFLAGILDRKISGYLAALDELEREVDHLDEVALNPDDTRELGPDLLQVRRSVGALRRRLAGHREVYAALTRPYLMTIASSANAGTFEELRTRFDNAVASLTSGRDMVVGTFDLFMMQTAQRTNDVMKLLTVVSVVLLPSVVIAGIMGMNFKVGLFDRAGFFWVVIAGMATLAAATLGLARWRRWL